MYGRSRCVVEDDCIEGHDCLTSYIVVDNCTEEGDIVAGDAV